MKAHDFEAFLSEFQSLRDGQRPFCVITLVKALGSTPQEVGARAIVGLDGLVYGTVGGGALEKKAIETAIDHLRRKEVESRLIEWNLQKDLGMSCGGVTGLFFEFHHPAKLWKICVFGAGHVAQELIRVLLRLECEITCVDSRADWIAKLPEHSRLKTRILAEPSEQVSALTPDTFITVMTMGHRADLPIVRAILEKEPFPYLGVIGSATKAKALKARLQESGISPEKTSVIHCPMGEDFGNNTPAEIALSIAAQLLRTRDALQNRV